MDIQSVGVLNDVKAQGSVMAARDAENDLLSFMQIMATGYKKQD